MCPRPRIPPRKPENTGAAYDRHLPLGRQHRVPAHHGQRAAAEPPLGEHEIEHHQIPLVAHIGQRVHPLSSAHHPRAQVRPHRQAIVDDQHLAKPVGVGARGGGPRHHHGRRFAAADDVVEVEVEVS